MKQLTIVFHLHHHEFHLLRHMGLWCSHYFTSIIDIYYYFFGLLLLPLHILIGPISELHNIEFGINCCLVFCLRNLTMLDLDHGHCHLDQSFFKVHQSLAFQISFLGWAPPWTGSGRNKSSIEHLSVISIISTFSILATTHMPLSILSILPEENSPINNIHIAGQPGSGD